jgi:ribulose 1,5-bisphosphate synthetase/thiazole synthase
LELFRPIETSTTNNLDDHCHQDLPLCGMTEVLIVGGGVFGLSTALSLARGKYKHNAAKILVIGQEGLSCNSLLVNLV